MVIYWAKTGLLKSEISTGNGQYKGTRWHQTEISLHEPNRTLTPKKHYVTFIQVLLLCLLVQDHTIGKANNYPPKILSIDS